MSQSGFRQDMPPQGGYGDIPYKKAMQIPKFKGLTKLLIAAGITLTSMYVCCKQIKRNIRLNWEENDARLATWPLVKAEHDRIYMLQLRRNREAETELMKDVPGWEVGTLYGEPLYHNFPKNFKVLTGSELYVHNNPRKLPYAHYSN